MSPLYLVLDTQPIQQLTSKPLVAPHAALGPASLVTFMASPELLRPLIVFACQSSFKFTGIHTSTVVTGNVPMQKLEFNKEIGQTAVQCRPQASVQTNNLFTCEWPLLFPLSLIFPMFVFPRSTLILLPLHVFGPSPKCVIVSVTPYQIFSLLYPQILFPITTAIPI